VLRRGGYSVYRTDQRGDIAVVPSGEGEGEPVGVAWRRR